MDRKEKKAMRDYLENQGRLHPDLQMDWWVQEVIRDIKVRRERRVNQV